MTEIYLTLAAIGCIGVVWFFVLRPALEDWGVLKPREEPVKAFTSTRQNEITLRQDRFPVLEKTIGNLHSQAEELPPELPKPELVPTDRELPIEIDDLFTELVLCHYVDKDGEVKQFTATKLADFFGGRKQETLERIRELRELPPPPPADPLRVKDSQGERLIPRQVLEH